MDRAIESHRLFRRRRGLDGVWHTGLSRRQRVFPSGSRNPDRARFVHRLLRDAPAGVLGVVCAGKRPRGSRAECRAQVSGGARKEGLAFRRRHAEHRRAAPVGGFSNCMGIGRACCARAADGVFRSPISTRRGRERFPAALHAPASFGPTSSFTGRCSAAAFWRARSGRSPTPTC